MTERGARVATLSSSDVTELERRGITADEAERQLSLLAEGPNYRSIERPCGVGDGILQLGKAEIQESLDEFEASCSARRLGKFVPASGAASRMFKALHAWRGRLSGDCGRELARRADEGDGTARAVQHFIEGAERFAFSDALAAALSSSGKELGALVAAGDWDPILEAVLSADGLALGELPKGLVPFHRYAEGPRTALAEHLAEAALLGPDSSGRCSVRLSVLPEHEPLFQRALAEEIPALERAQGVTFDVELSLQGPDTMTLALAADGEPFRSDDGSLLLRPGGHGAVIGNLGELAWDCALVGNIDNVVPDSGRAEAVRWKRVLAGHLLRLQARCFDAIRFLRQQSAPTEHDLLDIAGFVRRDLNVTLASGFDASSVDDRRATLLEALDRPLRVCGVVRNEGEPGGGPFWVRDDDGRTQPQIVEGAEIDRSDPEQRAFFAEATHFNPVNLACGLRDWRGRPYELERFVDEAAVFLSERSVEGRELTALERPGLWNGAMARWNTVFIEVPLHTFGPVKVVNDLLRPEHRATTMS